MRENEAGRPRLPWRSNPIIARLTDAGAHLSAAFLLATGVATSLAARKKNDVNGDNDGTRRDPNRDGGKEQDRGGERDERLRTDHQEKNNRDVEGEKRDRSDRDSGDRNRDRKDDSNNSANDEADVSGEQNNPDDRNGDGGKRDGGGGNQDGGGGGGGGEVDRGNAGSGFFDSPLATKARRRSNDFDNGNREDEEEGRIVVDVDPERESVYQTDSISYTTGPDGVEIITKNITYTAAPTPTPTPLPRLELPERDGFPFGEDFPFGVARPRQTPAAAEPPDPGDSAPVPTEPEPDISSPTEPPPSEPPPSDTDGGDNTMDFTS